MNDIAACSRYWQWNQGGSRLPYCLNWISNLTARWIMWLARKEQKHSYPTWTKPWPPTRRVAQHILDLPPHPGSWQIKVYEYIGIPKWKCNNAGGDCCWVGGGGGVDTRHFVQTEMFYMDTIFEWMDSAVWWSKMDSWRIHPVKGKAFLQGGWDFQLGCFDLPESSDSVSRVFSLLSSNQLPKGLRFDHGWHGHDIIVYNISLRKFPTMGHEAWFRWTLVDIQAN